MAPARSGCVKSTPESTTQMGAPLPTRRVAGEAFTARRPHWRWSSGSTPLLRRGVPVALTHAASKMEWLPVVASQPDESHPLLSQPLESQPELSQPEESHPDESQPLLSHPLESQPDESQPEESQPLLSHPLESQPDESHPDESQPLLSQPEE